MSIEEVLNLVEKPYRSAELREAILLQQEYKGFTERYATHVVLSVAQALLDPERYDKFSTVYRNFTIAIIDTIKTQYEKIFDADGGNFDTFFQSGEGQRDLSKSVVFEAAIRKHFYEGASPEQFWKAKGLHLILDSPNTLFFLDVDKDQIPYLKTYDITKVHSIDSNLSEIKHVLFFDEYDEHKIIYGADRENYIKITIKPKAEKNEYGDMVIIDEVQDIQLTPHNFGECPASWIFNRNLHTNCNIVKRSPIYQAIPHLLWYSLKKNGVELSDFEHHFPVAIYPEMGFDEQSPSENANTGAPYKNLPYSRNVYNYFVQGWSPSYKKNPFTSGGSIEVPGHGMGQNVQDLVNAFKYVEKDVNLAKYGNDNANALEQHILNIILGKGFGAVMDNQAINQDQVKSNFDTQEAQLASIASAVEESTSKMINLYAKVFDSSDFKESIYNLGRGYFLKTNEQLYEELTKLQNSNASLADLQEQTDKIRKSQNRNNPTKMQRAKLLNALQPFLDYTTQTIIQLKDLLSENQANDLFLRLNFTPIIQEFENEYGRIENYNSGLPFNQRLTEIKEIIYNIYIPRFKDRNGVQSSSPSNEL